MRVNPNYVPDIITDIQQSQMSLDTALQQLSTGKRVSQPSDDPFASSQMVQNTISSGTIDQYTQNISTVQSNVQSADSVLSTVVSLLTQAVSLGSEAANSANTASDISALATQAQGLLTSVVAQANTSVAGTFLFGGAYPSIPFTPSSTDPSGYAYRGTSDVNQVEVGLVTTVQSNIPGNTIFTNPSNNVLGSLANLVSAIKSGNKSNISTATGAISSAISYVGQQRVVYANIESQLTSQESVLQQDTVTLASQENNLIGVDEATAATNLSQAETDNNAALAAAAKVLPTTLLNYLSNPA